MMYKKLMTCLLLGGLVSGWSFCEELATPSSSAYSQDQMLRSLILVDEPADPVLDLLERLKGKEILRQQNLPKVQININYQAPISKADAALALETLLGMNGVAIIKIEGTEFLKAIPSKEAYTQAAQMWYDTTLNVPASSQFYSKIFPLNMLIPADAQKMLADVLTPKVGKAVPLSSALFVTDTLANLQQIERLLENADRPAGLNEKMRFYKLEYANAKTLRDQLSAMQKTPEQKKYLQGAYFDFHDSTNQLIVTAHPDTHAYVERFVSHVDINTDPLYRVEVIQLKHMQAIDIVSILKGVAVESRKTKDTAMSEQDRYFEELRKEKEKATQAKETQDASSIQKFSDALTLEADERSNSVVVFGTRRDIELVNETISKLDILLPQVRIQAIIAQVNLDRDKISGLSSFGFSIDTNPIAGTFRGPEGAKHKFTQINAPTSTNIANSPFSITGSLKDFSLETVFRVAQQNKNVEILSCPTIMTTHNKVGKIVVGERRPFLSSQTRDLASESTERISTEYQDIVLELEVTPLIGSDGVIELEVSQKVDDVIGGISVNGFDQPIVAKREATSYLSIRDQEVVVLAGLQGKVKRDSKGRLFLLGYIPLIGDRLFSPKTKVEQRTDLVIFLKPYIVRDPSDARINAEKVIQMSSYEKPINEILKQGAFSSECEKRPLTRKERLRQKRAARRSHCQPCEQ